MVTSRTGRLAFTALLAIYGFRIFLHPDAGSLVDAIDLPIHETGHLVFSPFGEFMQFAGGTLFQILFPCVFGVYFLKRKDPHAASVVLWWVAQNFANVSVYARDAQAQELPLVGGGEHDWAYLLGRLHLLYADQSIGRGIWAIGVVLFVMAIGWGLIALTGAPAKSDESTDEALSGSSVP
jgi:hypothetical protein